MCLAANVPLIESGTTGFDGQVQAIKKGKTACYDCTEKEVPKSFPVCTIRSTPSQPIHCIVWAKSYLLPELFGVSEDQAAVFDHSDDSENKEEIENLKREAEALKAIRESIGSEEFPSKVFTKVFQEDIERLRGMEDMWKSKKPPEPQSYDKLRDEASKVDSAISSNDQKIWETVENFAVFKDSLQRLSNRLHELKASNADPIIVFDKDDEDTLDFVAASANIRSLIFGIEAKSKFDVKQMAGNIIPAIATTNAMTAALCVFQALKVLKEDYARAKMLYLSKSDARAITTENLSPPNPSCAVCSVTTSEVQVDTSRATLNDLVDGVLRKELGYGDELSISNDVGLVYDPDFEDNLSKKFDDLNIKSDTFLTVVDDSEEDPRVNLQLSIMAKDLPEDAKPVALPEKPDIARRPKKLAAATEDQPIADGEMTAPAARDGNGEVAQVLEGTGMKRKRALSSPEMPDAEPLAKKGKAAASSAEKGDGVIVLDGEEEGAIVLD
ncbi:MAG: hypothetical protein Q9227_006084 [Pyrenula ochraceoflavens]